MSERFPQELTASITNRVTGHWQVTTENGSVYEIDADGRTIRRSPSRYDRHADGGLGPSVWIGRCRVGESAEFLVDVRRDGVLTRRTTGHVVSIARVESPSAGSWFAGVR